MSPPPLRRRPAPEGATCRICYEGAEAGELFKPCCCDGTMKYVHVSCLNTWRERGGARAREQCQSCGCCYRLGAVSAATILDRAWVVPVGCSVVHAALAATFWLAAAYYYPTEARLQCIAVMYASLGWVWMGLDLLASLPRGGGGGSSFTRPWSSSSNSSSGSGNKGASTFAIILVVIGVVLALYKVYTGVAHIVRKGRDRVQHLVLDQRDWGE